MHKSCMIAVVFLMHTPLLAQPSPPTPPAAPNSPTALITSATPAAVQSLTGQITLQFKEPGDQSDFGAQSRRFHTPIPAGTPLYLTAAQTFHVYIPPSYDGREPFGLIVYVSPSDRPMIPRGDWKRVFDRHKLIFICAEQTGNQQHSLHRFGAALDAVYHMPRQYKIDPERVYASGLSGGGRCSSMLGLAYPDLFNGAAPICGVNYYRNVPVPDQPGRIWQARFKTPSTALVGKARLHSRFALITGSEDFNRDETMATHQIMQEHRFKYVDYFEVPGMKHNLPNGEWLEKAIVQLDAPLKK